ncbi:unnamed protein product [Symbiodinium microadriaticum]|nr:unnamed protein product [Symbiodinium microadriaticum]CAE7948656.1 unnamed protein product [Symbiodinium sp. KB8]
MGCCQPGSQLGGNVVGASASGSASNLSAAQFKDIDAVVAVTQASVNAVMMQYLSKAQLQEVLKCYAYKPHSKGEIVEVDYKTLVSQAGGSDPFNLTDGADQTNTDVFNLAKAHFVGAFKAKGGLPKIPLAKTPSIITLGKHSDSPVSFNLTMSEFQVCGLTYSFEQAFAINKIQPSGSSAKTAWYYNFLVDLTLNTINPNAPVPDDVRERMKQFIDKFGPNSFSMQKLFLDLETASLVAEPVIKGVTDNTDFGPTWAMMSKIFTGAYFSQLRQTGNPIFGYAITSTNDPTPASTVAFQSLAYSTAPYLVDGQDTQSPASCLVYNLSTNNKPPGIQTFTWNWVDANDVSQTSGVLSVRRSFIVSYLTQQAASPSRGLCFDTFCTTHHSGENFTISTGIAASENPTSFVALPQPSPVTGGGMLTHTLSFTHNSKDDSENSSHTVSIFMDYNYHLDGQVVLKGTQIIITMTAKVAMGFHHHELGIHYTDLPLKDYYNKTKTITLDLAVSDDGKLTATETLTTQDNSSAWDFDGKGIEGITGLEGSLKDCLSTAQGDVNNLLDNAFKYFAGGLADNFNQYHQWVFPGADTFVMSHVFFSDSCDLVTQLRYASQSMNACMHEAGLMIMPVIKPEPPVVEEVTYNIAASAELMTNYIQSDILQPQKMFQALQTDAGLGLLFMIGTEDDFNVVVEESGKTRHGWTVRSLSQKLIKQSFPKGGTVSTFGVSQAAGKGTSREVHVAMCVQAGGTSNLYLSLHNSDADLNWTKDIPWLHAPFNAVDSSGKPVPVPQPLNIANIMLTQASDGEHIVVDILRNQEAAQPLLERYWIDVTKSQPLWMKHQMAADFEASTYKSALGRAKGDFVDGIYTMGKVNRVAQLVYVPLYNAFDPIVPPVASRLRLPGDLVPDAIATARHSNGDNDSDLYVASQGGLYYFAASNQGNDAVATKVVSEPTLLAGVKKLFAAEEKGDVTVWGLNGSNQVFYLNCKTDEVADSDAWSVPLPILTSVDAISPYVDRKFLANTFFAHTGTSLIKCIKTPGTGLWTSKSIALPPTSYKQDSRSIQSFTTEVKVTNQKTGMTAANVAVELTSTTVTSVSINHLYYQVGPQPVTVQTDQDGTITVVELTNSLVATRFHVAIATNMQGLGAVPMQVNPMDAAFKRNSALTSKDKLRDAKVTDMHGNQTPWIPPDTPDDTLDQIVNLNKDLDDASKDVGNSALPLAARRLAHTRRAAKLKVSGIDLDLGSARMVDIGDLFNALVSALKATIKFVKDEISGAWHVLAVIEGKIYAALMDTLEAIGGAIRWVYNQIKMAIEWVIMFLEFLFGWKDILVTHRVIKKFILLTAAEFVDDLASARAATKKALDDFKKNIAEFTGVKQGLKTTNAEALKSPDPSAKQNAPGNLGKHHFKGNATRASTPNKVDPGVPSALESLVNLCESAEQTLVDAAGQVKTQVIDQFSDLELTTVLERIAGIISIALVDATEDMILELFTVCEAFVDQLMGMLDHTIDIPIISWLYKLLTGDDLSLLDLLCLIAAIPTTIYYKLVMGHAPFSTSDAWTQRMLDAKTVRDWNNAPYDEEPLEGALLTDDQAKKKATQALALGAGAMAGTVIRLFCTAVRRDMQKDDIFSDDDIKLMESFRWIGSMAASAPSLNLNMFDKVPDVQEWYEGMSKVLTAWGKVRGFVQIFYVTNKNKMIGKAFSTLSTTENFLKLIPHIVTPVEENDWSAHIVLKTLGKVSNDCGGILSLPQKLTPSPGKEELFSYECMFRLSYGVLMITYPVTWFLGA